MRSIKQKFFRPQNILLFSIVCFAAFLRFYNYGNRFGLAGDQARDLLVVRWALHMHVLPLIGPFSATGPFVFGPYWYWFFMIPVGLFPSFFLAPWLLQSLLYIFAVYVMYRIGVMLKSDSFGLLLALFTAISPAEIGLSTNLVQSSLIGLLATGIFYFFLTYIQKKSLWYLSLLSLFIGLAVNTHFEAIPLLLLLPIAYFFGRRSMKYYLISFVFVCIPFLPLLIFNTQNHAYETGTILQYIYSHPQTTSIPKRWLTSITLSWPIRFSEAFGGIPFIGGVEFFSLFIFFLLDLWKKSVEKPIGILMLFFFGTIFVLRYFGGTLFENLLAFVFPLLLILITWLFYCLLQYNKYIGIFLIGIVCITSLVLDWQNISTSSNGAYQTAVALSKTLVTSYPNKKFAIYDYRSQTDSYSKSLSLLLDVAGKVSDDGVKIGLAPIGAPISYQLVTPHLTGTQLYMLRASTAQQIQQDGFTSFTPSHMYALVENWYK